MDHGILEYQVQYQIEKKGRHRTLHFPSMSVTIMAIIDIETDEILGYEVLATRKNYSTFDRALLAAFKYYLEMIYEETTGITITGYSQIGIG